MASVTFPVAYGGDGNTYTDDADPNTGLDDLGYTVRFVPALAQAVAMGGYTKGRADAANAFAVECRSLRDAVAADRAHVDQQKTAVDTTASQVSADAGQAALDAAATAADRVATGQDATATAADRVATGEDRQQTGLDRVATGEDAVAAAADRQQTGLDAQATAADRVATGQDASSASQSASSAATAADASLQAKNDAQSLYGDLAAVDTAKTTAVQSAQAASDEADQAALDAQATAADRIATGQDATATAEDRLQTGLDAAAAAADRIATGQDATATAADRVATGEDRSAAAQSALAAGTSEASAADALADFLRRYLGPHETPPTTDNAGDPLLVGALYYSTATDDEGMRQWTGSAWDNAYATIDSVTWASVTGKPATATRWPNAAEVEGLQEELDAIDALPPQSGKAGSVLTTDGTTAQWGVGTSAVTQALAAPVEIRDIDTWQVDASAVSRHVDGSVAAFEVIWWDGVLETVPATAGAATLSRAVDQPVGGTVSASVRALDDIGNISATQVLSADVVANRVPVGPIAISIPSSVGSGGSLNASFTGASDPDGDAYSYTITDPGTLTFAKTSGIAEGEQVSATAPTVDSDTLTTITVVAVDANGAQSAPYTADVTVLDQGVATPTITAPADGTLDVFADTVTIEASAFQAIGSADTQASADWELATDSAFTTIVASSLGDTVNLASWSPSDAPRGVTLYPRTRQTGVSNGTSDWSPLHSFTTLDNRAPSQPSISAPTQTGKGSVFQVSFSGATDPDGDPITYTVTDTGTFAFAKTTGIAEGELIDVTAPDVADETAVTFSAVAADDTGAQSSVVSATVNVTVSQAIGVEITATGGPGGTWNHIDEAGAAITSPTTSWFNGHPIFGGMQDVTVDGQTMVEVPKFYYKRGTSTAGNPAWWISDQPLAGFTVMPAFVLDGVEVASFQYGKYQASESGGKLQSVPGVLPKVSTSLTDFLGLATARNVGGVEGFRLHHYDMWLAVQWLYLVEMATMDSQTATGEGRVNESSAAVVDAADVAQATYRGIVGLWGNVRQWMDGLRTVAGSIERQAYNGAWSAIGGTIPFDATSGYPITFRASDEQFIADTFSSSNDAAATMPDQRYWSDADEYYPNVGGYWSDGAIAGLWYLVCYVAASNSYTYLGARLARVVS